MADTLKDVGEHKGTYGDGHYEAIVQDDGGVTITTIFNNARQAHTVSLSRGKWDRLVAWVEWQRNNRVS